MTKAEYDKVFKLPFNEASEFFKQKLNIPTKEWTDLELGEHAKGFMSAGAYNADLLADLRKITQKAIDGGMDIREFRKQFRPLVEKYGWELKGGGPGWRADLIWRTNISTAYAAGRWQQFETAGIKWLRYVHADGVRHPRPKHQAMHGTVREIGDAFWSTNYPPQGFRCHCRAEPVSATEYAKTPDKQKQLPPGWKDAADPGWGYNVGKSWRGSRPDAKGDTWEPLPYPKQQKGKPLPLDKPSRPLGQTVKDKAGMVQAVRDAIGGDEAFIRFEKDHLRQDVYMNAEWIGNHLDLNRGQYVPFLKETITDPAEIYLFFEKNIQTDRVRLSANFIKGIDLGKGKAAFLVSRVHNGMPEGWTFIPARASEIDRLRKGKLLYER